MDKNERLIQVQTKLRPEVLLEIEILRNTALTPDGRRPARSEVIAHLIGAGLATTKSLRKPTEENHGK